jgi:NAD(P)H-dependent FMN reductase
MHIISHIPDKVAIVIGSSRPQRICPQIAAWVQRSLVATGLIEVELVDLKEVGLPFLDEPIMASLGRYEHEHTIQWSERVRSYGAFVFVFPQYNWGYPAVLKNALDFLYDEWADKPAALVTYGSRGGGLAASQLTQVLQGLHMRSTDTNIELRTGEETYAGIGSLRDIDHAFSDYDEQLAALGTELQQLLKANALGGSVRTRNQQVSSFKETS